MKGAGFGSDAHSDLINVGTDEIFATYDLASNLSFADQEPDLTPWISTQFQNVELLSGTMISLTSLTNVTFTAVTENTPANNVPEPGTLALIGLGFAGIGFSLRKKSS